MGIAESLQWRSAIDPQYRQQAIALVSSWVDTLNQGGSLQLATDSWGAEAPLTAAAAQELLNSLQQGAVPSPVPVEPTGDANSPQDSEDQNENPFTQNLGAVLNPNQFPVRGNKYGTLAWKNLRYRIDYHDCSQRGCPVTQYYQSTLTVDPNSKTSRVSSQNVMWKKSVNRIANAHFQNYAVVRGKTVNNPNTANVDLPLSGGAKLFYITVPNNLQGNVLTIAPALWVKMNGYWVPEGAKTADAKCRKNAKKPAANLVCAY